MLVRIGIPYKSHTLGPCVNLCYRWQPTDRGPVLPSVFPACHIGALRGGLLHVLGHLRQIMLIQSHLGIEVTRIAMRLALSEIEGPVIIRVCRSLHEVL